MFWFNSPTPIAGMPQAAGVSYQRNVEFSASPKSGFYGLGHGRQTGETEQDYPEEGAEINLM